MKKPKAPSVADRINALTHGKSGVSSSKALVVPTVKESLQVEKLEKKKHGGKRPTAGRKPTGPTNVAMLQSDKRKRMHELLSDFADQEVEVKLRDADTGIQRMVKITRYMLSLHQQFKLIEKGDPTAINNFHDRLLGKAAQPIVGDDDAPPIQVEVGPRVKQIYDAYHISEGN